MNQKFTTTFSIAILLSLFLICSCNDAAEKSKKKLVIKKENIDKPTSESIRQLLIAALSQKGKLGDSTRLHLLVMVNDFYASNDYSNLWSQHHQWLPLADSVYDFITRSETFGLYPKYYHKNELQTIKRLISLDSIHRMDAKLWSKADVLFTDGCLRLLKDIKYGRLFNDSAVLANDSTLKYKFLTTTFANLFKQNNFSKWVAAAEPANLGYVHLKEGIPDFLDSMDRREYTYIPATFKKGDANDSLAFIKSLVLRLKESSCINFTNKFPDSLQLDSAIKKFQKRKFQKADGKLNINLIKLMNATDVEKFKRIAITLDRYKQLPDSMPAKYIWVNLPGYYMNVWDADTIVFNSKIICGKPETRTPLLNSAITDMITYPTWTVPTSIIAKQYLPKLKKNPYYLSRLGLKLKNEKGQEIDPASISWGKYTKGIPYKVMQGSGDDNALGILKFNFENPYAVYLHDTNQRYLFGKSSRALSHGCVRVQEWEKLAYYIARNDSMNLKLGDTLRYTSDSIRNWLAVKKHKFINVKNKIPLFIKYFSCEGKEGKIKFYEDIYGEDKALRDKYFNDKINF